MIATLGEIKSVGSSFESPRKLKVFSDLKDGTAVARGV
jgi:hypothetical protein